MVKRMLRRWRIRLGPDGRRILALHDDLEGLIFVEESAWLYRAARGQRRIVEIGSYRGKSCVLLALGSADVGGHVIAIDPHRNLGSHDRIAYGPDDHEAFLDATRRYGVADRLTKQTMTSREGREVYDGEPIDLLWIDGDHSYEGVKYDLSAWKGLVRAGGIVAVHDYSHHETVRRAWNEEITPDGRFGTRRIVRSIAWAACGLPVSK